MILFGGILIFFILALKPWKNTPHTRIDYYSGFQFHVKSGKMNLRKKLGNSPPSVGGFVTCSFEIPSWIHRFNLQPQLCSYLDHDLNLTMHLEDKWTQAGTQRVIQLRQKNIPSQTLLGEPIHRGILRFTYLKKTSWLGTYYYLEEIYQLFEQEFEPGKFRSVESFTRDPKGELKEVTESSALNFTSEDLYATYNGKGDLVQIPKALNRSFIFPAKLDVSKVKKIDLPKKIDSKI